MRKSSLLGCLLLALNLVGCENMAVVYLVRHAEKATAQRYGNNPPLSQAGQERAEDLAEHLMDSGINLIIVTQYMRTQKTAQPLADALGLEPVVINAGNTDEIATYVKTEGMGNAVLVVGHSNTIPAIITNLGAEPPLEEIAENDFDNLFVVLSRGDGQGIAGNTTYGSPSP